MVSNLSTKKATAYQLRYKILSLSDNPGEQNLYIRNKRTKLTFNYCKVKIK